MHLAKAHGNTGCLQRTLCTKVFFFLNCTTCRKEITMLKVDPVVHDFTSLDSQKDRQRKGKAPVQRNQISIAIQSIQTHSTNQNLAKNNVPQDKSGCAVSSASIEVAADGTSGCAGASSLCSSRAVLFQSHKLVIPSAKCFGKARHRLGVLQSSQCSHWEGLAKSEDSSCVRKTA